MISYIMFGTNDLDKAVNFFDIILHPLGLHRVELDRDYAGYAKKKGIRDRVLCDQAL